MVKFSMKRSTNKQSTLLLIIGSCLSLALTSILYTRVTIFSAHNIPLASSATAQQLRHSNAEPAPQVFNTQTSPSNSTGFIVGKPISQTLDNLYGSDQLSTGSRKALTDQLDATVARLQTENVLPKTFSDITVQFELPIRAAQGTESFGYHTISNYLDHASVIGALQDYHCSNRTYDAGDGYNHTGTDFMPFPFPWQKMDRNEVEVLAAADGVIIEREDGNYDRECIPSERQANMIILQHENGTQSWYLHFKNGSVTGKQIGDSVTTGEYLGTIGSSGRSSGPHLHFEVQDEDGNVIDPFFESQHASCNTTTDRSLWVNQPAYNNSSISDIVTSASQPEFPPCEKAILPEQSAFAPGDRLLINVFYRDDSSDVKTAFSLIKPDGKNALKWEHQPESFAPSSVWSFPVTLPDSIELGEWEIEAAHNDKVYAQQVSFVSSVPATATPTATFTPVPTVVSAAVTPIPVTNTPTATGAPPTSTSEPTSTSTNSPTPVPSTPITATPITATTPQPTITANKSVYLPAVTK